MTPNQKLENLCDNSSDTLREAFTSTVCMAFAAQVATIELSMPELHAQNAAVLRTLTIERVLESLGVTAQLFETMRMQITQERANVVPFSTARQ